MKSTGSPAGPTKGKLRTSTALETDLAESGIVQGIVHTESVRIGAFKGRHAAGEQLHWHHGEQSRNCLRSDRQFKDRSLDTGDCLANCPDLASHGLVDKGNRSNPLGGRSGDMNNDGQIA